MDIEIGYRVSLKAAISSKFLDQLDSEDQSFILNPIWRNHLRNLAIWISATKISVVMCRLPGSLLERREETIIRRYQPNISQRI